MDNLKENWDSFWWGTKYLIAATRHKWNGDWGSATHESHYLIERYELDRSMILETSYRNFKNVHDYMYMIFDYHEHNYTNFNILMLAILNLESSILGKL